MVATADFPQADRLMQVGEVARAVAAGNYSDVDIERFIGLNSQGRQGRYYRLAAEILGLLMPSGNMNRSDLSEVGAEFATLATEQARRDFLARTLTETAVFKTGLDYIHRHRPSEAQLRVWFQQFYPGSANTANRRFATFFSYLRDAQLLEVAGDRLLVGRYRGAIAKKRADIEQGLRGRHVQRRIREDVLESGVIQVEIDAQKRERANMLHWNLVAAKAAFLDERGLPTQENAVIDLFSAVGSDTIIYEMKSVAANNLLSQVRKAVAQLYEYRFVFAVPNARLCVVTNGTPPPNQAWLGRYLTRDREIAFEWTEDFQTFTAADRSRTLLGPFSP